MFTWAIIYGLTHGLNNLLGISWLFGAMVIDVFSIIMFTSAIALIGKGKI